MSVTEAFLQEKTLEAFASLGLPVQPSTREVNVNGDAIFFAGCISFSGAWVGALVMEFSFEVAGKATEALFGVEADAGSDAELKDTVGEVVNLVAGALMAEMPAPCTMSLSTVVKGFCFQLVIPDCQVIERLGFECDGNAFNVNVLEKQPRRMKDANSDCG